MFFAEQSKWQWVVLFEKPSLISGPQGVVVA